MKKRRIVFGISLIIALSFIIHVNVNYETPILMYHSLDKAKIKEYPVVSEENFRRQVSFIEKGGYEVISLKEYCQKLKNADPVSRKTIVITFDDGLKDNLKAVDILNKFDYPATFFLIVNNIGKTGFLSKPEIKKILLKGNIGVGSHTLSHAYLPDAAPQKLKNEIYKSRQILQNDYSGGDTISYPVGGFNKKVLKEAEAAGYICACATNRGFSKKRDRFALRRIKISNRDVGFRFWAKLSGFYNVFKKPKKPY